MANHSYTTPTFSQDDARRLWPLHAGEFCLSPHCTFCLCSACLTPLGEGHHAH
jgi:hypothetical protein